MPFNFNEFSDVPHTEFDTSEETLIPGRITVYPGILAFGVNSEKLIIATRS